MLPDLAYMAVKPEPREVAEYSRAPTRNLQPQRRIIWLLFDELSYDQLFDHRQPEIRLPGFDRFTAESVSFSNVQPAGFYTELIIPSLLLGTRIEQERSDLAGRVSVKTAQGWQANPDDRTIFSGAERTGLAAAATGLYIPYCRTYARELDSCMEILRSPIPGYYSPEKPVW